MVVNSLLEIASAAEVENLSETQPQLHPPQFVNMGFNPDLSKCIPLRGFEYL